jgi:MYXO-CTERM domain-containing protein
LNRTLISSCGFSLVAASVASAGIITEGGTGFIIDGSSIHTSDIVLDPATYGELANLSVQVGLNGLQHDWLGDLVVTLTHVESGASVSLFGTVGGGVFGSSAEMDGFYTFNDGIYNAAIPAQGNLWQAADDAEAGGGVVAGGFYYATNNASPDFVSMNAAFAGITSAGTWRLSIEDTYPFGDDGALLKWTISLTGDVVPAPGAIALLGLAGFAGRGRRRD